MVGITEEAELDRLQQEVDDGVGDVALYLSLLRKLKVRRSHKAVKHGLALVDNPTSRKKLGNEVWTVYEQVAMAAMDCYCLDVAQECIKVLTEKFPDSIRVGRLEGMWFETKGLWQQADKLYNNLLEMQPLDPQVQKRRVAIAKAQGNLTRAVELLKQYLEIFMADHDAWRELAEIYVSLQKYNQAAFCYEELIMMQTSNALWHLNYAEVQYTLGGLENLKIAKKYYATVIKLSGGKNLRALYGICLCASAINQVKGRSKEEKESLDLQSLAATVVIKEYKMKCQKKVALVTSALEKQQIYF